MSFILSYQLYKVRNLVRNSRNLPHRIYLSPHNKNLSYVTETKNNPFMFSYSVYFIYFCSQFATYTLQFLQKERRNRSKSLA